jgi:hypothetical protein
MSARAAAGWMIALLLAGCATSSGPVEAPTIDLEGTRWQIVYDNPNFGHRDYDLFFKAQGRLVNTHPDDKTTDNDTWTLRGRKITLRFNNGYAVYVGQLVDSDHMTGSATSVSGGAWNWKAIRWGPPVQLALP